MTAKFREAFGLADNEWSRCPISHSAPSRFWSHPEKSYTPPKCWQHFEHLKMTASKTPRCFGHAGHRRQGYGVPVFGTNFSSI
jgi:hypothetical protein